MNTRFPKHIGFIMDGNGRWAKKRLLPRELGHKAGAETLKKLIEEIEKTSIEHVTVYAFSTENWKRSDSEVKALMKLLKNYIDEFIRKIETLDLKIDIIGDTSILNEELKNSIKLLEELSREKTGLKLHIALNYGARDEIVRAIKKISKDVKKGDLSIEDLTEEMVSKYLDTKNTPDPDLIVRTSGELRMSNFLLWQSAYSELYFSEKLWPDFTFEDLNLALKAFNKRDRRFGKRIKEKTYDS